MLLKLSSNDLIYYSKNLFNITCWIYSLKNHYFIDYKDEKIKKRLKESDVNWVFIDSMFHINHY